jgi:hypothetical protein
MLLPQLDSQILGELAHCDRTPVHNACHFGIINDTKLQFAIGREAPSVDIDTPYRSVAVVNNKKLGMNIDGFTRRQLLEMIHV